MVIYYFSLVSFFLFGISGGSTQEMATLSTHILDISKGFPAADVKVTLYASKELQDTQLQQGKTNDNGRLEFIQQQLLPGQYKLRFDIKPYFDQLNTSSLFPFIDIVFKVQGTEKLHIPLLLSPYGYSTYRGS